MNGKVIDYFKKFLQSEQAGGILLLIFTVIALIIANSEYSTDYFKFFELKIGLSLDNFTYQKTVHQFVNDGLMALFFLLIGLEIKREIISGELSTYQKAISPVLAALGGMIGPALIFLFVNFNKPTISGWGIPTATDIAFSLAVLSLIKGVPKSLRIFLVALAVADDIGAIIIIGIFYSTLINILDCVLALLVIGILVVMNRRGIEKLSYYLLFGFLLWFLLADSGIHATIAGVILAFTIPYNKDSHDSPLHKLEEFLFKPVGFIILPLFALANTGIAIDKDFIQSLMLPNSIGIFFGLWLGKPLGILSAVLISSKLKISKLPTNTRIIDIISLGFICGVGYTMSILISTLAYSNQDYIDSSKISILLASMVSAITGLMLFKLFSKKNHT